MKIIGPDATNFQTEDQDDANAPSQDTSSSDKPAVEQAETFSKAVGKLGYPDIAEKALRFATLPAGIKRAATRVMPTVKKAAKVAPIVTPAANPYILKAVAKAKEVAPEVAQAAKAVASGAQTGAKTATGHIRTTAPKLGHAAAGKV